MPDRARQWFPFVERNGDVVVSNRDPLFERELLFESQRALKPSGASLWISHRQSEVADDADSERRFLAHVIKRRWSRRSWAGALPRQSRWPQTTPRRGRA